MQTKDEHDSHKIAEAKTVVQPREKIYREKVMYQTTDKFTGRATAVSIKAKNSFVQTRNDPVRHRLFGRAHAPCRLHVGDAPAAAPPTFGEAPPPDVASRKRLSLSSNTVLSRSMPDCPQPAFPLGTAGRKDSYRTMARIPLSIWGRGIAAAVSGGAGTEGMHDARRCEVGE